MPMEKVEMLNNDVFEENKQLKLQVEEQKNKIIELEAKLANYNNGNDGLSGKVSKLENKVEELNSKIIYITTYLELKQNEDLILGIDKRLNNIEKSSKIDSKPVVKEEKIVNFEEEKIKKEEVKQENLIETLDTKKVLAEIEAEETNEEAPATLGNGEILVTNREEVDDLTLSNANKFLNQMGDDLKVNGDNKEEVKEEKAPVVEERYVPKSDNNIIQEIEEPEEIQEQPQAVVEQEEIMPQVAQEEIIEPVVNEFAIKYEAKNIKALKTCVSSIHSINPRFQSNRECDIIDFPQNIKDNFNNNLSISQIEFNQGIARTA